MSERLEKLRRSMDAAGFDAIWISSPENHLYFSGFQNPDGRLLICRDAAFAFEDFRYIEAARREISAGDFDVIMPEEPRRAYLPELLRLNGVHTAAYEDETLSCRALAALEKDCRGAECRFVPEDSLIAPLRLIKDSAEADCIRKAQRIAEKSFSELLPDITPDVTEAWLAARLEFLMKQNGSEGASFETIAVSGRNSSSPHGVPRPVKLEKGFLTFDFGAMYKGYHSDMTRTVCLGHADEKMKRLYSTVLCAQEAVLSRITDGASCFEMDRTARDIIDTAGYRGAFGHALGHGVGLEIHEAPTLSTHSGDDRLAPGMIVTVEPGIYLSGRYGCRIEDMVFITPGGAENLTSCPKELIEL